MEAMTTENPGLARPSEVATYLGTTPGGLGNLRYLGRGPKFVKVGRRVMYRWADVDAYVEAQTFAQTGGAR